VAKDEKLALIRSVPLFAHCGEKELEAIALAADMIDVQPGMELVTQGARTNEFVVIAAGTAEASQDGKTISTMTSGEFFGEIALVTGAPRTATVTATAPSTLLVLTDRAFWRVAEETPSIQTAVLKALAERLHAETV
jgi:CRP-like cAMP-binding protein